MKTTLLAGAAVAAGTGLVGLSPLGRLGGARVRVRDPFVVVEIRGIDKIYTMRRRIHIRLDSIMSVRVEADPRGHLREKMRLLGTAVPGVLRAGAYRGEHGTTFWLARNGPAIVMELSYGWYQRVVVELDDPATVLEEITRALEGIDPEALAEHT